MFISSTFLPDRIPVRITDKLAIHTWVFDRCFCENEPSEPNSIVVNDKIKDFKQKLEFLKTQTWELGILLIVKTFLMRLMVILVTRMFRYCILNLEDPYNLATSIFQMINIYIELRNKAKEKIHSNYNIKQWILMDQNTKSY